ncbi:hypothetical protein L9F63_021715 [Diploptera punctata]|uniref:2-oxo-4-hydroxy-4-carboxy-5-ureidoimidazoline decarboxylase n=1 Tax=Diploptera punctata TaxID=6984 RepID=A0AAD7ZP29_DIPPU|nr:hypothetical protein L9F63_021715 [Diploptera punctata]
MAKGMKIEEVNSLINDECVDVFKNIVECFPQVAKAICTQRPFRSAEHMADVAGKYLDQLPTEGKEEVLKLHPDLAGRLADEGKLTSESTKEQKSAGLDKLSAQEKIKMNQLNTSYREKFGFPFVICARENKVEAILQGLEARLKNTRDNELGTGINEVKKICRLRIDDLVTS